MAAEARVTWDKVTEGIPKGVRDKWWTKMTRSYAQHGRQAHSMSCLQRKFEELETFSGKISNTDAFIYALFFQYFHYDPRDSECSARNMQNFDSFAREAGISGGAVHQAVRNLLEDSFVYSTDEHKTVGAYGDNDIHYFLDIDLMMFGFTPEDYKKHVCEIAKEYYFLSENTYKNLRWRVLRTFLTIPNIYATKIFRDKYEKVARSNIQIELDHLGV